MKRNVLPSWSAMSTGRNREIETGTWEPCWIYTQIRMGSTNEYFTSGNLRDGKNGTRGAERKDFTVRAIRFPCCGGNPTRVARQKTPVVVCHTPHGKRRLLTCGFHPFGRRGTVLPARVLSESRLNRSRALLRASSTVTLPTVYKFIQSSCPHVVLFSCHVDPHANEERCGSWWWWRRCRCRSDSLPEVESCPVQPHPRRHAFTYDLASRWC